MRLKTHCDVKDCAPSFALKNLKARSRECSDSSAEPMWSFRCLSVGVLRISQSEQATACAIFVIYSRHVPSVTRIGRSASQSFESGPTNQTSKCQTELDNFY